MIECIRKKFRKILSRIDRERKSVPPSPRWDKFPSSCEDCCVLRMQFDQELRNTQDDSQNESQDESQNERSNLTGRIAFAR